MSVSKTVRRLLLASMAIAPVCAWAQETTDSAAGGATLHKRLARYYERYLPIRLFEVPFELPRLAEAMQWHRQFNTDPGTLWLRGVLKEVARNMESARRDTQTAARPVIPFPDSPAHRSRR